MTVWKRERRDEASVRRESGVRELTEEVRLEEVEVAAGACGGAVTKVEGSEGSMGMLDAVEEEESAVVEG